MLKTVINFSTPGSTNSQALDRLLAEQDRVQKLQQLNQLIGWRCLELKKMMDTAAVPETDSRRELTVDSATWKLASELGFNQLHGIRLVLA